jgi:hypothetical protein
MTNAIQEQIQLMTRPLYLAGSWMLNSLAAACRATKGSELAQISCILIKVTYEGVSLLATGDLESFS